MTGSGDFIGAHRTELGATIGSELAAEVGRALDVETTCASWVLDAEADSLLLILNLRGRPGIYGSTNPRLIA
jgi:hypothetical protein